MLQQYFIELGEGYGDVYELMELMETNKHRLHRAFIFSSKKQGWTSYFFSCGLSTLPETAIYADLHLQGRHYTNGCIQIEKRGSSLKKLPFKMDRNRFSSI